LKYNKKENLKERRTAMKGKGKWAVLLLALGLTVAGCVGSSGSSDESAVAAKDNPVLGTWQVTVDQGNQKLSIEPVTLEASSIFTGNTAGAVVVTDLVNRSSNTQVITLTGVVATTLAFAHIIPGSERVTQTALKTLKVRGVDYTINYSLPAMMGGGSVIAGSQPGNITRTAGSSIVSGSTVTIEYGYRTTANQSLVGNVFTTDIMIENHTNNQIEKLRSWTGKVTGPGAASLPNIGDGTTSTGRADYPLLAPQTGGSYEKASTTPQGINGFTAGVC
jgi:hypothetical protein